MNSAVNLQCIALFIFRGWLRTGEAGSEDDSGMFSVVVLIEQDRRGASVVRTFSSRVLEKEGVDGWLWVVPAVGGCRRSPFRTACM